MTAKFIPVLCLLFLLSACSKPVPDVAISELDAFISEQKIDKSDPDWKTKLVKPPRVAFKPLVQYFWDLVTNKGTRSMKLLSLDAPMHVSSTIYLTRLGFYDDIIFHRVIPGFMAQGGDPKGTGAGGPGYKYAGEYEGVGSHTKAGILSMANAGRNTDGSQFFLTFKATPFLDGRHTVFGEVVSGMETLQILEQLGSRSGKTQEELKIITASIRVEQIEE